MKKVLLALSLLATLTATEASAQVWIADSVNCTPGIKKDVWYSLENGTVKSDTVSNWVMSLSMMNQTGAIWANHVDGVRIFNTHKTTSQLATITLADTATSTQQYNTDYTWERGAMNVNRNPLDTFDYGWGSYDQVSHNVYGDTVYLINKGASYYAIAIDSLIGSSMTYHTRVASLTPPLQPFPFVFAKGATYANKNFMYIGTGQTGLFPVDREPETATWDIVFGKYFGVVPVGGGGTAIYPVAGALTNYKTEVARVQGVALDDAFAAGQTYARNTRINNIGSDWKFFTGTNYVYPDSLSFIVKAKDNMLWQIKFTGYSSTTGDMKFNKRKIGFPLQVKDVTSAVTSLTVSPNPTQGDAVIVLEAQRATKATMRVMNTNGATIAQRNIDVETGINAFTADLSRLSSGMYIISIIGADVQVSTRIVKQ
jgi:hypothetical protein